MYQPEASRILGKLRQGGLSEVHGNPIALRVQACTISCICRRRNKNSNHINTH